jgi:hypothetical protein
MSFWDKFVEEWLNASSIRFTNDDDYFDMIDWRLYREFDKITAESDKIFNDYDEKE